MWFIEFILARNTVTCGINWSIDVATECEFCSNSCCAISVVCSPLNVSRGLCNSVALCWPQCVLGLIINCVIGLMFEISTRN